jgi:hypothetical protein
MRIFSSVVRRLPFIRLTPLAKVLRLTLFIDPFSEAQPGFTEARALGRQGDERAIIKLRRTIRRHPGTSDAEMASTVLKELGISEAIPPPA